MKLTQNDSVKIERCPCCQQRLLVDTRTGSLARVDGGDEARTIRGELRPSGIVVEHSVAK